MYPEYRIVAPRGHALENVLQSAFWSGAPFYKPMVIRGMHVFLREGKIVLLQAGKDILGRRETPINALDGAEPVITASLTQQQRKGRKRR